MSVSKLSFRYAKSLLDLAIEHNKLDIVTNDVKSLLESIANPDLNMMLKSPIINIGKKRQIFKALFEGRMNEMTMSFLNIILTKGREPELKEILNQYMAQYKSLNKITDVTITSAVALDQATVDNIVQKLIDSKEVEKAEVKVKVNPALIGGFILEFDDKLMDASVLYRLGQIRNNFSSKDYIKQI